MISASNGHGNGNSTAATLTTNGAGGDGIGRSDGARDGGTGGSSFGSNNGRIYGSGGEDQERAPNRSSPVTVKALPPVLVAIVHKWAAPLRE